VAFCKALAANTLRRRRQTAMKQAWKRAGKGCRAARGLPKSIKQTFTQKNQAYGLKWLGKWLNL